MAKFGENPVRLGLYRSLHTVKFLTGGLQSKEVRLLSGNKIVAKCFDPQNEKHVAAFKTEVQNYEALQGCSFVPEVLVIDREKLIIYMRYCGESPTEYTSELKKTLRAMVTRLRQKYKLTRHFFNRLDGLPRLSNVAVDNRKRVKLIDLGPPFHLLSK